MSDMSESPVIWEGDDESVQSMRKEEPDFIYNENIQHLPHEPTWLANVMRRGEHVFNGANIYGVHDRVPERFCEKLDHMAKTVSPPYRLEENGLVVEFFQSGVVPPFLGTVGDAERAALVSAYENFDKHMSEREGDTKTDD